MRISSAIFLLFCSLSSYPQSDSLNPVPGSDPRPVLQKKRFLAVVAGEAVLAGASVLGLNEVWYDDHTRVPLHSFNDNREWLGMDKAGHIMASYYIGRIGIGLMKWSGAEHKRSVLYGGFLGTGYLTILELFDGFSSGWGFSWGDMAANLAGSLMVSAQELCWGGQRITLKFSYHPTGYPEYRPELLGRSPAEKLFKDYNGQTYWVSLNLASFMGNGSRFPAWLNAAVGYGATGMIGGLEKFPGWQSHPSFERYPQFYIALDADLWRIKTRSRFLKGFFSTFGFIKIPLPAIELNKYGVKVYPLYF